MSRKLTQSIATTLGIRELKLVILFCANILLWLKWFFMPSAHHWMMLILSICKFCLLRLTAKFFSLLAAKIHGFPAMLLVSVSSSCFTSCLNGVTQLLALFGFCWSNSMVVTLGLERILWAQWAGAVSSSLVCGQTQAQHPALPPALSFLINECSLSPEGSSEVYNSILYCWFPFFKALQSPFY